MLLAGSVLGSIYACRVPGRSLSSLVVLSGLDYVLWAWTVAHGPTGLAVGAGLALPPLLFALLWMVAVAAIRRISDLVHSASSSPAVRPVGLGAEVHVLASSAATPAGTRVVGARTVSGAGAATTAPGKIAA